MLVDDAGKGGRGPKPSLTTQVAEAVADEWGLATADARALGGSTGLNLQAWAAHGPVVVRVHRRHVSTSRVEALQLAREVAFEAGAPVALPVLGRHGRRTRIVDNCAIEVERFIDSDARMDTLDRIATAMPALAHLHDVLAAAELPDPADDLRFANYLPPGDAGRRVAAGAARIRRIYPRLVVTADAAEALAERLDETSTAAPPMPSQWCHGDFWDNNVLFRHEKVVLVTDFGFMNRRPRIEDLALTLYFTLWDLHAAGHPDPMRRLAALAEAYDRGTLRPLRQVERDALPLAIARQPLWSVGVWAAELDDPRAVVAHLRGHGAALRLASSLLDNVDRWRSAFRR